MYQIKKDYENFSISKLDDNFNIIEENCKIKLENNKYLENDIIDIDGNIIESFYRNNYIVGFLSTSSTITFGKNKNKKIYSFTPLNYKLPKFMVSYNGKLKGKILLIIKFVEWEKNLPKGNIINIIGNFNEENLVKSYLYYYHIDFKNLRLEPKINEKEYNLIRENFNDLYTISIDPKGSVDIDDAISIDENYIYIHIAQPITYMGEIDLMNLMEKRFSTIYLNDRNIELFGNEIMKKATLKEMEEKKAYTVIFDFDGNYISSKPSIVTVNKNLSYDYVNKNRENFSILFSRSESIFGSLDCAEKMIEKWMIKTNCAIGNILDNNIFRINSTKVKKNIDSNLAKYFYENSKYVIENKSNKNEHNILQVKNYVHFTSPIRRIVDNIIHYRLTYKTNNLNLTMKNLRKINENSLNISRFHRTLKKYNFIKNLPEESFVDGIIVDNQKEKIIIYIENIGIINLPKTNKYGKIIDFNSDDKIIKLKLEKVSNVFPDKMLIIKTEFDVNLFI